MLSTGQHSGNRCGLWLSLKCTPRVLTNLTLGWKMSWNRSGNAPLLTTAIALPSAELPPYLPSWISMWLFFPCMQVFVVYQLLWKAFPVHTIKSVIPLFYRILLCFVFLYCAYHSLILHMSICQFVSWGIFNKSRALSVLFTIITPET